MSNEARDETIGTALDNWLARYTPPRHMQSNDVAMQAEANAMFDALAKIGPGQGYAEWIERTLTEMDGRMRTRAWPTVGELSETAKQVAQKMAPARRSFRPHNGHQQSDEEQERQNSLRKIANAIKSGQPVTEHAAWGRLAVELVQFGHITSEQRDRLRSGVFFKYRSMYGEEKARKHEEECKARHEHGERLHRADREQERQKYNLPHHEHEPEHDYGDMIDA
jgi:hypothetical protein